MTWVGSGHTSTLLTKGKVSSLMKTKSKRQRKFKETWVSKKWNKSGATLDERWRRRRNKDKKEMDDDRRSGIATRKVKTAKPLKMPLNLGIFLSFFISLVYTLPADFHFPADIQYFPRNGRYVPVFGADRLPWYIQYYFYRCNWCIALFNKKSCRK